MQTATWLFVGVCVMGLVVSIALAPETRGRSLDELEQLANNGWRDINGKPVHHSAFDPKE